MVLPPIDHECSLQKVVMDLAEGNVTCGGLPMEVEVSTPDLGPNDRVYTNGNFHPLDGRVHDCAADARVLAIVTGSSVVLIDAKTDKTEVIDHTGGDRVALGPGWLAWSNRQAVHARHR